MCVDAGTPSAGTVNKESLKMLQGYAKAVPLMLSTEQQYKPGFVQSNLQAADLGLWGNNETPGYMQQVQGAAGSAAGLNTYGRQANVNDVGALGNQAAQAIRSIDPATSQLLDQYTKGAYTDLAAGSQIDPQTANTSKNEVLNDWSNRGLGTSNAAQLDQAMKYFGSSMSAKMARAQLAGQALSAGSNLVTNALGLTQNNAGIPATAAGLAQTGMAAGGGAGPTLMPSSLYGNSWNTIYGNKTQADMQSSQNAAALAGGAMSY